MKRFLWARRIVQFIFLLLLFFGLQRNAAPLLILLIPLSFVAGNFFCGWICPLGTLEELAGNIGSLVTKKKLQLPRAVQNWAQYARYLIFVFLVLLFTLGELPLDANGYLPIYANQSLARYFMGAPLSLIALGFLAFVLLLSFVTERPFCNYICMGGLKYAVPSSTRLFTVRRNSGKCLECGKCDGACPMHIPVSEAHELRHLQCVNCFRCIGACPAEGALTYGRANASIRWMRYKLRRFLRTGRRVLR